MPRLWVKILLFLSSYSPLFLLLAWTARTDGYVWIPLCALAALSVGVLIAIVLVKQDAKGPLIEIEHWQRRDSEITGYVATYLVPFFGLDLTMANDAVTLLLFLVVIGIIYVSSSMLYVNPVLSLLGYHLFQIESSNRSEFLLVSKRSNFNQDRAIQPLALGDYVKFEP